MQFLVPTVLRKRLLFHLHFQLLADHPGQQSNHGSMWKNFRWLDMANDVIFSVSNIPACTRNRNRYSLKTKVQQFPASGPLEFIAIELSGLFKCTTNANQQTILMVHRYSKLATAVPAGTTTGTNVTKVFSVS